MTGYAKAAIVTASLAAALAVTSCSDGAEAEPTPTSAGSSSSASSSSSTSATSSASSATSSSTATVSVPAAAKAHTEEGAKAFAEFYLVTYSRAAMRADSAPVAALSDVKCGGCRSLINLIDAYKAKGQHVDRASLVIDASSTRPDSSSTQPIVDVLAKDGKKRVIDADGSIAKTVASANINFRLTMTWTPNGWRVRDLRVVQ